MTLMYKLIGVLVDVVQCIATTEKEGMTVIALASQLRAAWEAMHRDTDDPITKHDFQKLLGEQEIVRITQDVGVDVIMLVDMADVVFEDYEKEDKNMTFENFVELMLKMRGNNAATVKDVREHLKVTRATVKTGIDTILKDINGEFKKIRDELQQQAEMAHAMHQENLAMAQEDSDDDGFGVGIAAVNSLVTNAGDEAD